MTKSEFLNVLENNLKDHLTSTEVLEQMNYYEEYFKNEIKKGRKEYEILQELGDPVLIAKTIKTVDAVDDELNGQNNNNNNNKYNNNEENFNQYKNNSQKQSSKTKYQSNWGCTLICIILFVVLSLGMRFLGAITTFIFNHSLAFILIIVMFFFLTGLRKK